MKEFPHLGNEYVLHIVTREYDPHPLSTCTYSCASLLGTGARGCNLMTPAMLRAKFRKQGGDDWALGWLNVTRFDWSGISANQLRTRDIYEHLT